MPLTPDGDFLAYKSVQANFTDWYSGQHDFSIGQIREMARNQVCDNADVGCSAGFHAGSEEYAKSFNGGGNLVIVKINPADVVSVPTDCECQKLRAYRLEVVALYRKALDKELYDKVYDNYIHPYRPEAQEAMKCLDMMTKMITRMMKMIMIMPMMALYNPMLIITASVTQRQGDSLKAK
jgi:hypothetical protein